MTTEAKNSCSGTKVREQRLAAYLQSGGRLGKGKEILREEAK